MNLISIRLYTSHLRSQVLYQGTGLDRVEQSRARRSGARQGRAGPGGAGPAGQGRAREFVLSEENAVPPHPAAQAKAAAEEAHTPLAPPWEP